MLVSGSVAHKAGRFQLDISTPFFLFGCERYVGSLVLFSSMYEYYP